MWDSNIEESYHIDLMKTAAMINTRNSPSTVAGAATIVVLALVALMNVAVVCDGGTTSRFVRKLEESVDMPFNADVFRPPPGRNAPQQVHITQGDHDGRGVIVSWVTPLWRSSKDVTYWQADGDYHEKKKVKGIVTRYKYYNYTSGYIHHATINHLDYDTKYHYKVGIGKTARTFWFRTPPHPSPDVAYTFGLIGDLGQTYDSNSTLTHYQHNPAKGKAVLYVGDLSYADHYPDHDNRRWDTWGRFTERSVAYQPWIWTAGNHEIDFAPELNELKPFKPYSHRYHVPFRASGSSDRLWYSLKRASAYIIVLSSYSPYGNTNNLQSEALKFSIAFCSMTRKRMAGCFRISIRLIYSLYVMFHFSTATYTPQWQWLQAELPKVNRSETPWLIVLMHSPWYNSYNYHYMEGESMRVEFESWFVKYKVDVVFAGHVHAYERSERVSNIKYNITNKLCTPIDDVSAPVYITIGDGGNIEGLATSMTEPQPSYSAYREASFGHGIFDIKNRTHAYFSWHRNQDGSAVEADGMQFFNRYWYPADDSTS